jgi:hypothetical protein
MRPIHILLPAPTTIQSLHLPAPPLLFRLQSQSSSDPHFPLRISSPLRRAQTSSMPGHALPQTIHGTDRDLKQRLLVAFLP